MSSDPINSNDTFRSIHSAGRLGVYAVVILALLWIGHTSTQAFVMGVDRTTFMREKVSLGFKPWFAWRALLMIHVASAVSAMIAGGVSLVLGVLQTRMVVHRLSGRIYVIAVFISGFAAVPLTFTATGGILAIGGFLLLNHAWLKTTIMSYRAARMRDIATHQKWVTWSYAITFANMSVHILTTALTGFFNNHAIAYTVAIWIGWPINVAIAEAWRRRKCDSQNGNL